MQAMVIAKTQEAKDKRRMQNLEPTNAPLMVIDSQTKYGFFAIDPLGDTWIEAAPVIDLWRGQGQIPVLRSRRAELEIWFVSLDWLIQRYPDIAQLKAAQSALAQRVQEQGFEAD
jgi:hypothetical protein